MGHTTRLDNPCALMGFPLNSTRSPPLIALSASVMKGDREAVHTDSEREPGPVELSTFRTIQNTHIART